MICCFSTKPLRVPTEELQGIVFHRRNDKILKKMGFQKRLRTYLIQVNLHSIKKIEQEKSSIKRYAYLLGESSLSISIS